MKKIIRGKVYVIGDNIDTDQIIPAEFLVYSLSDAEERKLYGRYALSSVPPAAAGLPQGNIPFVREGEFKSDYAIVIGGRNFGCGSSREHAPFALREAGIEAVVAEFYARIFFRNSVNGGYLIPYETPRRLVDKFRTGDEAEIELAANVIRNLTQGTEYALNPLGDIAPILEAGDVFAYARQAGMARRGGA
ncbi:MAG: 3-isopropylmalate dehydratase [bacterium]|nr:3-isopropylmalate dehydratase [bacterium]